MSVVTKSPYYIHSENGIYYNRIVVNVDILISYKYRESSMWDEVRMYNTIWKLHVPFNKNAYTDLCITNDGYLICTPTSSLGSVYTGISHGIYYGINSNSKRYPIGIEVQYYNQYTGDTMNRMLVKVRLVNDTPDVYYEGDREIRMIFDASLVSRESIHVAINSCKKDMIDSYGRCDLELNYIKHDYNCGRIYATLTVGDKNMGVYGYINYIIYLLYSDIEPILDDGWSLLPYKHV